MVMTLLLLTMTIVTGNISYLHSKPSTEEQKHLANFLIFIIDGLDQWSTFLSRSSLMLPWTLVTQIDKQSISVFLYMEKPKPKDLFITA